LCPATAPWLPMAQTARASATLMVAAAAWLAARHSALELRGAPIIPTFRFDRVWIDFRDLFGIVWARRVQERFNDEMRRRKTGLQLGMLGLESSADPVRTATTNATADV